MEGGRQRGRGRGGEGTQAGTDPSLSPPAFQQDVRAERWPSSVNDRPAGRAAQAAAVPDSGAPAADAGGAFVAVQETEEPMPAQLRNALLTVILLGILLTATLVVLDQVIPQGGYRLLAAGLIVAGLGITLAVAAAFWTREPTPWKHRFIPQTYTDIALPRTVSFLGAEVPPGQKYVIQERLVSATWMRELLTERIMLAQGLTPSQLGAALDRPNEADFLEGKTNLRRFLADTKDLAVASKGSVLMMSKKEYLKTMEAALKEAESL